MLPEKIRAIVAHDRPLATIISLGVILHLAVFWSFVTISSHHPDALNGDYPVIGGGFDSTQYMSLADHIFRYGNFSVEPGADARAETFRTPGYPFLVGAMHRLFGTDLFMPILQALMAGMIAWLISAIAREISPKLRIPGLVGAVAFMLDPSVSLFGVQFIDTEIPYALCFLVSVFFLVRKTNRMAISYAIAGVAAAVSAYMRPAGLVIIAPLAIWVIVDARWRSGGRRSWRAVGAFAMALIVILGPWFVRNGMQTGVYGFSSLSAYNSLNFNLPQYFSYRDKKPIETVRARLHAEIGNISDDDQMRLENSGLIKAVVWREIRPSLVGYAVFHVSKSANFFWSPGLKYAVMYIRGFFAPQPVEPWMPDKSLVNSVLDGRFRDAGAWLAGNAAYIPESIILVLMSVGAVYFAFAARDRRAVFLVLLIIFFGMLTSPLSNPEYRIPALPLIYLCGFSGLWLWHLGRRVRTAGSQLAG